MKKQKQNKKPLPQKTQPIPTQKLKQSWRCHLPLSYELEEEESITVKHCGKKKLPGMGLGDATTA